MVISWKKPTTPNGLIRHYSVYYRLLPTGTFLKLITVEANVTNSTLNVVGGLSYQFGVCATTVKEGPKATKNETIRDYGKSLIWSTLSNLIPKFSIVNKANQASAKHCQ